jgi:hypothetical protein
MIVRLQARLHHLYGSAKAQGFAGEDLGAEPLAVIARLDRAIQ